MQNIIIFSSMQYNKPCSGRNKNIYLEYVPSKTTCINIQIYFWKADESLL